MAKRNRRKSSGRDDSTADELEEKGMTFGRKTLIGDPTVKQAAMSAGFKPEEASSVVEYYKSSLEKLEPEETEDAIERNRTELDNIIAEIEKRPPALVEFLESRREPDGDDEYEEEQELRRPKRRMRKRSRKLDETQPDEIADTESASAPKPEDIEKLRRRQAYGAVKESSQVEESAQGELQEDFAAPKPKEQVRLEKKIEELEGAVEFLETKIESLQKYNETILDQQEVLEVDRIFHKTLVYSALAHAENGALLVVERKSIREALKQGSTGEVLWHKENGEPWILSSNQEAEDKISIPLHREQNDLVRKKANVDEKTKVEIEQKITEIWEKRRLLRDRTVNADENMIYGSVLEYQQRDGRWIKIEQDPEVLEGLEVDQKTGEVKGAEKLIRKPVQKPVDQVELGKDGLDIRIMRHFMGGLAGKQASEKTGKKVIWKEKKGLDITEQDLEEYALDGLEMLTENAQLKITIDHDQRKIRDQEKDITSLKGEVKPLRKQVKLLEVEKTQASTKINGLRAENAEQEESLNLTSSELAKLQARFELSGQYKKELEETITGSNSELTKAKEELAGIREELAQTRQMLEKERRAFPGRLRAEYKRGKSEGKEESDAEYDQKLQKIQKQRERELKNLEAKLGKAATKGKQQEIWMKEIKKRLEYDYELKLDRKALEIEGLEAIRKKLEAQVRLLKNRPPYEKYTDALAESRAKDKQIKELEKRPTQADVDKKAREVRDFHQKRLDEYEQTVHEFIEDLREEHGVREDKLVKAIRGIYETALKDVIDETITIEEAEHLLDLHITLSNDFLLRVERAKAKDDEDNYKARLRLSLRRIRDEYKERLKTLKDRLADVVVDKTQAEFDHRVELNAERKRTESAEEIAVELDADYRKELHAERGRNTDLSARLGRLEDGFGDLIELDADYRKELHAEREKNRRESDRGDGLEKERDELRDSLKAIADYDLTKLVEEEGVNELKGKVSEKLHYLVDQFAGYVRAQKERDDLVEGLKRIAKYEINRLTEKGEVDKLKAKVPENIHYFIELAAKYAQSRKRLGEYEEQLRRIRDIDVGKLAEEGTKGLEGIPRAVIELIQRCLESGGPRPSDRQPGYGRQPFAQQGVPIYGRADTGFEVWVSDKLFDMRGRIGYLKGMVKELRGSRCSEPINAQIGELEQEADELHSRLQSVSDD